MTVADDIILAGPAGEPIVFEALGAWFHLDPDAAELEEALTDVVALLDDWLGEKLRFSKISSAPEVRPHRRVALEYIASYPAQLDCGPTPGEPVPDSEDGIIAANLIKVGRDDFSVVCWDGSTPNEPGRREVRFWSEIAMVQAGMKRLPACPVLDFTVPIDTPLEQFQERALAIASKLPIRWGAAGYTYAYDSASVPRDAFDAIYKHSRRFHGFDPGYRIRASELLSNCIRSVNWLTFVGPKLRARIKSGELDAVVDVAELPNGALALRAGPVPARGDVNRLDLPDAYRVVDTLCRAIRCTDAESLDDAFPGPWTEATVAAWLRRLEARKAH